MSHGDGSALLERDEHVHDPEAITDAPAGAARLRHAVRKPSNWFQLTRFLLVGASGYVVNLAVYSAAVHLADFDYRVAATMAFLVAVTNNFVWHRRWTFAARHVPRTAQATRFLTVSVAAFVASLAVLQILVGVLDLD